MRLRGGAQDNDPLQPQRKGKDMHNWVMKQVST
jgi:hypothetical protein